MKQILFKPKNRHIAWVILMIVLTACGNHSSGHRHLKQMYEVRAAGVQDVLHFAGTVQPIREATLTSPVDGILEHMNYVYGQRVKKGEVVFIVNSAAMQKQYNDALTDYLKAKDNFIIAKTKFNGTEDLWNAGLIAKNNYLSEQSNLNTAHVTMMQALHTLSDLVEKTDGRNTRVLSKLSLAEFEKVQEELNMDHHLLQFKAPMNGVVLFPPTSGDVKTSRLSVGSPIKAGQALALIGDLSGIRVEIDIPEVDIDKIKPGLSAVISGVAFKQHELHGQLTTITSQAAVSGSGALPSFQAIVEVKSLDEQQQAWIKTGMSATVDLAISQDEQLMIPIAAVHAIHGERRVNLQLPDGTIKEQRIETGASQADRVAVVKGLKAGDRLVYE